MGRAKRQQIEKIGTTTHKNKIRHTQKQSGTTTHSNKKTSLKITNKTKQKGETTRKKPLLLFIYRKMKNTYIIAVKQGFEPILITQQPNNDITYIGKHYKHAYIMESKQKAQETRGKRYKQREERKADPAYKNTYF